MKRYEEIAELIAVDIRSGLLSPGSRLPSVRSLMARHGISPATAFKAYYRLEERGLVRARERSGYFVANTAKVKTPEPSPLIRSALSPVVDINELVFTILESARDQQLAPLGSAFPSPSLFPLQRLARSLASSSRFIQPEETVASLPPGHKGLRMQIALRYLGMGMPQPADELIITNGALEALNLCLGVVARPGDLVAIESPGFYAAAQALERLGMKAIEIPVHPRNGLDLGALADALKRHPIRACWFMTSFQNPMGTSMDLDAKRALVELLARHEVPMIEDDVYGELYFGKQYPLPAKAFDRKGLVMHCSSFSKTLAPGYRIGWVSPGRFGQAIERMKLMTTLSASVPAQVAIADYLHTGAYDKHLRKLRHALESQLAGINTVLMRHFPAAISVSRPQGGYFVWVQFERTFDPLALHHAAVASGISIAPGPMFSPSRQYRNCLRLNYGFPWTEAHERGLTGLAGWMADHAG